MTEDYICQNCGFRSSDPQSVREHDCDTYSLTKRVAKLCAATPEHDLTTVKAVHFYVTKDTEWQTHTHNSQGEKIRICQTWSEREIWEFVAVDVLGWFDGDTVIGSFGNLETGLSPEDRHVHEYKFWIYYLKDKENTTNILVLEW